MSGDWDEESGWRRDKTGMRTGWKGWGRRHWSWRRKGQRSVITSAHSDRSQDGVSSNSFQTLPQGIPPDHL